MGKIAIAAPDCGDEPPKKRTKRKRPLVTPKEIKAVELNLEKIKHVTGIRAVREA